MAVAAGAANAVEVGLGVLGEIEVDDNVDGLDVDSTGEQVGAHEIPAHTVAEVVEHSVSGGLGHLGVAVKAGVTELGDLLGKKLNTVGGVAEDDRLVDLQLGEERVQAVHLLLLFYESVVLGDAAQRELVHQIDLVRCVHVLIGKVFDGDGEGGGEEHELTVLGMTPKDLLDGLKELDREQLICFIHNEHGAFAQVGDILSCKICYSAGGADEDVDRLAETEYVVSQAGATGCDHDVDVEVLAQGLAHL